MAKLSFPEDSGDCIERRWAPEVLRGFPAWKAFWEDFVGHVPDQPVGLDTYGLRHATPGPSVSPCDRAVYTSICSRNHHVFFNVAGCHHQQGQLSAALGESDPADRHFLHWEAFHCFYHLLGAATNALDELSKAIENLTNKSANRASVAKFLQRSDPALAARLSDFKDTAQNMRDMLVHHYCVASIALRGAYCVPLKLPRRVRHSLLTWQQQLQQPETEFITSDARLCQDLAAFKRVADDMYGRLHARLEHNLHHIGLEINR